MHSSPEETTELRRLRVLHDALARALEQRRWTALAEIDAHIAEYLRQSPRGPRSERVEQARRHLRTQHAQALGSCRAEAERLRRWLLDYLEQAEGRLAYTQIHRMQE